MSKFEQRPDFAFYKHFFGELLPNKKQSRSRAVNFQQPHPNDFHRWFDELEEYVSDTKEVEEENGNENKNDESRKNIQFNWKTNEVAVNFVEMIVDCLGLNHISINNKKIDDKYMCGLGDPARLSIKEMKTLKLQIFSRIVSKVIAQQYQDFKNSNLNKNEIYGDDNDDEAELMEMSDESSEESSDAPDDEDNKDEYSYHKCLETYVNREMSNRKEKENDSNEVLNGFMLDKNFLRTVIDAIKCRTSISTLIDFNFGPDNKFQIGESQVFSLLLEISQESTHKKLISSAIEQRIPIPILYVMGQINCARDNNNINNNNNNNDLLIEAQFYLRDNLYLASQSKFICDGMNQTAIERDLPLVMFLGSNNVQNKSSLLQEIYGKFFNVVKHNRTPLHSTSVDLIYLPKYIECNYHILDVHGCINDTFFNYCGCSRIKSLILLAKLCHCVVIQIDSSELSSKFVKKCKKGKEFDLFDITTIISETKGKAKEVVQFYNQLRNVDKKNEIEICIVIHNCNQEEMTAISKCNLKNIFRLEPASIRNEVDTFVSSLKMWLKRRTSRAPKSSSSNNCWWEKISDTGLVLPFNNVKVFDSHDNYATYMSKRRKLQLFQRLLKKEFAILGKDAIEWLDKNHGTAKDKKSLQKLAYVIDSTFDKKTERVFPFGNAWQDYTTNYEVSKIHFVAKFKASKLLQIFMYFCMWPSDMDFDPWLKLHSEYLIILNEECNLYNRDCFSRLEEYIKREAVVFIPNVQNNGKNKVKDITQDTLDKLNHCRITSYDFISNCNALFNFGESYLWKDSLHDKQRQYLSDFLTRFKLFSRRLFVQGTPVAFTDSLNNDIHDGFVVSVFSGFDYNHTTNITTTTKSKSQSQNNYDYIHKNNNRVISVAVAGPQSSGKSTLLRRLFGIDARVSAGKTTKGINCCRVELNTHKDDLANVDLMLVDTEGINSIEASTKSENSLDNRKRNNKIMLAALASSSVFLLNIMKEPRDAQLLDVILWAYEKLDLKSANKKQLSNIRFIFVIRDVQEYSDPSWLEKQKRKVNNYLNESIKLAPKYIDNEFNSIDTIDDLIGKPEYFAMPSAFDTNDAPNPQFSKRCVELRQKILGHFNLDAHTRNSISGIRGIVSRSNNSPNRPNTVSNKYNNLEYKNSLQWSKTMISIWRSIIRLENVLCVSDFRDQAMIKVLRKQVKICLNKLRERVSEEMDKIIKQALHSSDDHAQRCQTFASLLIDLVNKEKEKLMQSFDDNETLNALEISDDIIESYKQEFSNQVNIAIDERKKQFDYKSRALAALAIDNHIILLLDNLINELKNEQLKDDKRIYERYKATMDKIKEDYRKDNSKNRIQTRVEKRFDKAYETHVIKPNILQGKQPSSLKSLTEATKVLTAKDAKTSSKLLPNQRQRKSSRLKDQIQSRVASWVQQHITNPERYSIIDEKKEYKDDQHNKNDSVYGLDASDTYYHENWDDAHAWCEIFDTLDNFMNLWDQAHYKQLKISEEYRCEAHMLLRREIISKVVKLHLKKIKRDVERIEKIQKERYSWFEESVQTIRDDIGVAKYVCEQLQMDIELSVKGEIDSFVYNAIESNCKYQESKVFLQNTFNEAFDKRTGTAQKAMTFINNQASMMKNAFDSQVMTVKNNLLNDMTLRDHKTQWIQSAIAKICQFLDEMDENSGKDAENKDEDDNNEETFTAINVRKFLIDRGIQIRIQWFGLLITKCPTFVKGLKEELNKLTPNDILKDDSFASQFDRSFRNNRSIFYKRLLGCMKFCPYCNAKCQLEHGHKGRCQTNNHFLLAFAGHYNAKTNKLRINVCCSQSNAKQNWTDKTKTWNKVVTFVNKMIDVSKLYDESQSWDDHVRRHNPQWHPISPANFDKENVQLMLFSFFNKGLQKELLDKYNNNDSKRTLIAATKKDVECKDDINTNSY